jgi:hypothetical protein
MYLIQPRDRQQVPEIEERGIDGPLPRLTLYGELRTALFEDEEIDLALIDVPEKPEVHPESLDIFEKIAILHRMASDRIHKRT